MRHLNSESKLGKQPDHRRAGNRVGDNAKVAILEIIGYQFKEKEKKKTKKEEPAEANS